MQTLLDVLDEKEHCTEDSTCLFKLEWLLGSGSNAIYYETKIFPWWRFLGMTNPGTDSPVRGQNVPGGRSSAGSAGTCVSLKPACLCFQSIYANLTFSAATVSVSIAFQLFSK